MNTLPENKNKKQKSAPKFGATSYKQALFLNHDSFLTVYGGAAGSGKSYTGLLKFLKWCDDPDFVGYVFRLHATDLKKEGGAFWTAVKIFQAFRKGVTYTQQPMVIRFPSGASVSFIGMDDKAGREAIQGIEISAAMCDEATHFNEDDIWWIISRLRTNANMSPCIWLTCNPDPHSFILKWIQSYYINPEGTYVNDELVEGRPIEEHNGDERYYLRVGNDLHWGSSFEELYEAHHHKFGIDPYTGKNMCKPRSFRFIGATCFDNPEMLKKNPDYVSSLASQPRVTMERLLMGNWLAVEEESGYFKRSWVSMRNPHDPKDMSYLKDVIRRVRAYDLAGSIPSEAYPNPDWTVGVLIAKTKQGDYIVEDVVRWRKRSGESLEEIIRVAKDDNKRYGKVQLYLPQDPGQAGQETRIFRAKLFAGEGLKVKFIKVSSKKNKLIRFEPFSNAAENEIVSVVKADWNDEYFSELEGFDLVSKTRKDDQVDATSDSFNVLATTKEYKRLSSALIG